MRTVTIVAAGLLYGLAMLEAAHAGTKGYSGNWFLDLTDASVRARVYAGNRLLIEDTGTSWTLKSWRIVRGNEERSWEVSGDLEGKSCNVAFDPQAGNNRLGPLTCRVHREGDKVVLELIREVARTNQRFTHALSGDGQVMTVEYEYLEQSGAGPRHTVDTRGTGEIFRKT
jgi:hypothetical protein